MTEETKDFTPEMALNWIRMESDRLKTPDQISARLKQEFALQQIMDNPINLEHFPKVIQAHKDLIERLKAKLAKIERLKSFTVIHGGKE